MTTRSATAPSANDAFAESTYATRDMMTLRALHVARGTRSGAAVLAALLTIFWFSRAFGQPIATTVSFRVIGPLLLGVALMATLVALRPFRGQHGLGRVTLEGSALAIASSVAVSVSGASVDSGTSAIHVVSTLLMLGYAMFVPAPVRLGIATLVVMALAFPVARWLWGGTHPGDLRFAAMTADIAGGFAVALIVLSIQSVLFRRRFALLAEVGRVADIDGLTGALNRRSLLARLNGEFERARRYGGTLGMLIFDVDDFKRFNVEFGYHVGDRMLIELARTLDREVHAHGHVERGACVGRYGGEEFVVLLPAVDADALLAFGEAARRALSELRVNVDGAEHGLTVSVGSVHTDSSNPGSAADLLAQADRALYRAKDAGGNRVDAARDDVGARGVHRALFEDRLIAPMFSVAPSPAAVARDRLQIHTALLRWIAVTGALWTAAYAINDLTVALGLGQPFPLELGTVARLVLSGLVFAIVLRLWNSRVDRWVPLLHHTGVLLLSTAIIAWMVVAEGALDSYFASLVFPIATLSFALASSATAVAATSLIIVTGYVVTMLSLNPGDLPFAEIALRTATLAAISMTSVAAHVVMRQRRDEELGAREGLAVLSRIDPLTGLPNRRSFDARIEHEVSRLRESDEHLTLILLDLDRFKEINDRFGHLAGDAAIAAAGARITAALRASDAAARLGGEEFAVILPHTDIEAAAVVAERLREAVGRTTIADSSEPLSASLGVAAWRHGESARELVDRADRALRRAKVAGRNRVGMAGGPEDG